MFSMARAIQIRKAMFPFDHMQVRRASWISEKGCHIHVPHVSVIVGRPRKTNWKSLGVFGRKRVVKVVFGHLVHFDVSLLTYLFISSQL